MAGKIANCKIDRVAAAFVSNAEFNGQVLDIGTSTIRSMC